MIPPTRNSLGTLLVHLREAGYRITTPRRLVLEILLDNPHGHCHYSLEMVAQELAARGIDLDVTTVYRILQWLKDAGVIAQTDLGEGHDVYSLAGLAPHHHLVCLHCHAIVEVEDTLFDPLRATLLERFHFQPRIEHFAVFGLCEVCAKQAPD